MDGKRKIVAVLAKDFHAGKITLKEFLLSAPDDDSDKDISELIDLITHEPQRGGPLGVSPKDHDRYLEEINKLIETLSS